MRRSIIIIFIFVILPWSVQGSERKIQVLYNSLNRNSIAELLSFYELYPGSEEGKKALSQAWSLLSGKGSPKETLIERALHAGIIEGIVSLVNRRPNEDLPVLDNQQLEIIESLGERLFNRHLKGFQAKTEKEILILPSEQIDIARAILLSQGDEKQTPESIRNYEAMIDLLALQIATKLSDNAFPSEKIRAINAFIFYEMGFRFPPHSQYSKEIDLYTFLPSVLDSRHGVCLGVSILYLSIAQRLGLPLEIITPPGHIYIRYKTPKKEINIETTARGIHIPSEEYLGIETRKLQERSLKEVVGLAHINHASVFLREENYAEAIRCYNKALPYLPEDKQLRELLGYCYLFTDNPEKGRALLREINGTIPEWGVDKETMAEDFLNGNADVEALKAVFLPVDENRISIIKKKDALEKAVTKCPYFREGWHSLAIAWLQLHRIKEALKILEKCYNLDPESLTTEYYLAALYEARQDYGHAWKHLQQAELMADEFNHHPKALKALRQTLAQKSPE